jgi:hypothetical protein
MIIREADCCIAILENLSLRGNFWPGACAAAIKELQTSLDEKVSAESQPASNRNGPRQAGSLTPGLARPQTSGSARPTTSTNGRDGWDDAERYQAPSGLNDFGSQAQGLPGMPVGSVDFPDQSQNSSYGSHNGSHHAKAQRSNILNTAPSQAGLSSNQMIELPTYQSYNSAGFWPALDAGVEGPFNGVDDIFQLMDVPYLLSDDLSHSTSELLGMHGYSTI